jgi:hypothetical protein
MLKEELITKSEFLLILFWFDIMMNNLALIQKSNYLMENYFIFEEHG